MKFELDCVIKLREELGNNRFLVIYNTGLGDPLTPALYQATKDFKEGEVTTQQAHWLETSDIEPFFARVKESDTVFLDRMESVKPESVATMVKLAKEHPENWVTFVFVIRHTEGLADAQKACPGLMEFNCQYSKFLDWNFGSL